MSEDKEVVELSQGEEGPRQVPTDKHYLKDWQQKQSLGISSQRGRWRTRKICWTDQKSRENGVVNTLTYLEYITYIEGASDASERSHTVRIINLK